MCEESTACYLGLYLSALLSVCTKDCTSCDPLFKLLKFVGNITESIDDTWKGRPLWAKNKFTHSPQRRQALISPNIYSIISICNQWCEHRGAVQISQDNGMRISPIWPQRMLLQHHFWQLTVSQSGPLQSYRSIIESILNPSITDWSHLASHCCEGSMSFKPLRGLWSPGCSASQTHTHLHNDRVRKKAKKISPNLPTGTATCVTRLVDLNHRHGQTPFFSNMRVRMKRLLTLQFKYLHYSCRRVVHTAFLY